MSKWKLIGSKAIQKAQKNEKELSKSDYKIGMAKRSFI